MGKTGQLFKREFLRVPDALAAELEQAVGSQHGPPMRTFLAARHVKAQRAAAVKLASSLQGKDASPNEDLARSLLTVLLHHSHSSLQLHEPLIRCLHGAAVTPLLVGQALQHALQSLLGCAAAAAAAAAAESSPSATQSGFPSFCNVSLLAAILKEPWTQPALLAVPAMARALYDSVLALVTRYGILFEQWQSVEPTAMAVGSQDRFVECEGVLRLANSLVGLAPDSIADPLTWFTGLQGAACDILRCNKHSQQCLRQAALLFVTVMTSRWAHQDASLEPHVYAAAVIAWLHESPSTQTDPLTGVKPSWLHHLSFSAQCAVLQAASVRLGADVLRACSTGASGTPTLVALVSYMLTHRQLDADPLVVDAQVCCLRACLRRLVAMLTEAVPEAPAHNDTPRADHLWSRQQCCPAILGLSTHALLTHVIQPTLDTVLRLWAIASVSSSDLFRVLQPAALLLRQVATGHLSDRADVVDADATAAAAARACVGRTTEHILAADWASVSLFEPLTGLVGLFGLGIIPDLDHLFRRCIPLLSSQNSRAKVAKLLQDVLCLLRDQEAGRLSVEPSSAAVTEAAAVYWGPSFDDVIRGSECVPDDESPNAVPEFTGVEEGAVTMHWIPLLLEVFPTALSLVLNRVAGLSGSPKDTPAWLPLMGQPQRLRTLFILLHSARHNVKQLRGTSVAQLCDVAGLPLVMVDWAMLHRDSGVRVAALQLVGAGTRPTNPVSRAEMAAMCKALVASFKTDAAGYRSKVLTHFRRFFVRMRDSTRKKLSSLCAEERALERKVRKAKGARGETMRDRLTQIPTEAKHIVKTLQTDVLHLFDTLCHSIYPGAPYPRETMAMDLLLKLLSVWGNHGVTFDAESGRVVNSFYKKHHIDGQTRVTPSREGQSNGPICGDQTVDDWLRSHDLHLVDGQSFLSDLWSGERVSCLFTVLHSRFDNDRSFAFYGLLQAPTPLPLILPQAASQQQQAKLLCLRALEGLHATQPRIADTAALCLRLLYHKYVLSGLFDVSMTWSFDAEAYAGDVQPEAGALGDHGFGVYEVHVRARDPSEDGGEGNAVYCAAFVASVVRMLQAQVAVAERHLGVAAVRAPMHPLLAALGYLMTDTNLRVHASGWKPILSDLVQLTERVARVCLIVVGDLLVEAYSDPEAPTQVSAVPKENSYVSSTTRSYLKICAWMSINEVSQLMGVVVCRLPPALSPEWLSLEDVKQLGETFVYVISSTMHRGALEGANLGFEQLCGWLVGCGDAEASALPRQWLQRLAGDVSGAQRSAANLVITRRSAGLPLLFASVLKAEAHHTHQGTNQATTAWAMDFLLTTAADGIDKSSTTGDDQMETKGYPAAVHALNVLRALMSDAKLAPTVGTYLEQCTMLALQGYTSRSWAVRNSATLLFTSVAPKVIHRSGKGTKFAGTVSVIHFFERYTQLYELIPRLLHRSKGEGGTVVYSALYPILLLLSGLRPSLVTPEPTALVQPRHLISGVAHALSHGNGLVRSMAAKAMLALVAGDDVHTCVAALLQQVPPLASDAGSESVQPPQPRPVANALDGVVACVAALLGRAPVAVDDAAKVWPMLWERRWVLHPTCAAPTARSWITCVKVMWAQLDPSQRAAVVACLWARLYRGHGSDGNGGGQGHMLPGVALLRRDAAALLLRHAKEHLDAARVTHLVQDAQYEVRILALRLAPEPVLRTLVLERVGEERDANCLPYLLHAVVRVQPLVRSRTELWARLQQLWERYRANLAIGEALLVCKGWLLGAWLTDLCAQQLEGDDVASVQQAWTAWLTIVKDQCRDECPFAVRRSALRSIVATGAAQSLIAAEVRCALGSDFCFELWCCMVTLLEDDDDDIREEAAYAWSWVLLRAYGDELVGSGFSLQVSACLQALFALVSGPLMDRMLATRFLVHHLATTSNQLNDMTMAHMHVDVDAIIFDVEPFNFNAESIVVSELAAWGLRRLLQHGDVGDTACNDVVVASLQHAVTQLSAVAQHVDHLMDTIPQLWVNFVGFHAAVSGPLYRCLLALLTAGCCVDSGVLRKEVPQCLVKRVLQWANRMTGPRVVWQIGHKLLTLLQDGDQKCAQVPLFFVSSMDKLEQGSEVEGGKEE